MAFRLHLGWSVPLLFAIYSYVALILNSSILHVTAEELRVCASPIPSPYPTKRRIPRSRLAQLFVQEKAGHNEYGAVTKVSYGLSALLKNGKQVQLVDLPYTPAEEVRSIEEALEQFLDIEDAPVRGEFPGTK